MADGARKFDVSLVTPDGPAFEGEAEMIVVPGAAGDIGVLARHAPLIATLRAGPTRVYIDRDGEMREYATGPGFFQVQLDRAIALVDDAVLASEVDDARAREQLETAQAELERVDRGESNADRWQLEQRIKHAENQLTVAGRGTPPRRAFPAARGCPAPRVARSRFQFPVRIRGRPGGLPPNRHVRALFVTLSSHRVREGSDPAVSDQEEPGSQERSGDDADP